jgi:endo-1,4-beta-xylanase
MKKIILWAAIILEFTNLNAQNTSFDSLWNDPAIKERIQKGIEVNRKGDFRLQFPSLKGNVQIEVKQVKHDFNFGANGFMVNGFETKEKNKRYEEVLTSLFNMVSVPFYWKTLEPEQGKLRFDTASTFIYRRPPPDAVLHFCKQYNVIPKGHTLVWNHPVHSLPEWLPKDNAAIEKLIENRIKIIARRYGSSIKTWDVVNEPLRNFPDVIMPEDYVFKAFQAAQRLFPSSTTLMINEATGVWEHNQQEKSPYYVLIQSLLERKAPIGGIGLQFHFFSEQLHKDVIEGKAMTPGQLFAILDLYEKFKKPLHVSEITIPSLPYDEEGRQNQAKLTRNFYRLWFSHPAVDAIIWWNVVDGTAVKGEDKWNGGLVNNDFSPKPSFEVLNNLINKEWKTSFTQTVMNKKSISFRGFYGEYLVRIKQGKKVIERTVKFTKEVNSIRIN